MFKKELILEASGQTLEKAKAGHYKNYLYGGETSIGNIYFTLMFYFKGLTIPNEPQCFLKAELENNHNISKIVMRFSLKIKQTGFQKFYQTEYTKESNIFGWNKGSVTTSDLKKLNTLTIQCSFQILFLYDNLNHSIKKDLWMAYLDDMSQENVADEAKRILKSNLKIKELLSEIISLKKQVSKLQKDVDLLKSNKPDELFQFLSELNLLRYEDNFIKNKITTSDKIRAIELEPFLKEIGIKNELDIKHILKKTKKMRKHLPDIQQQK